MAYQPIKVESSHFINYDVWLSSLQTLYLNLTNRMENEFSVDSKEDISSQFMYIEQAILDRQHHYRIPRPQLSILASLIKYKIGCVSDYESKEFAEGYLKTALAGLEQQVQNPDCILLAISILEKLNALLVDSYRFREAEEYLSKCMRILELFDCKKLPFIVSLEDLFLSDEVRAEKITSTESDDTHLKLLNRMYSNALSHYWSGLLKVISEDAYFASFEWVQVIIDFFSVLLFSKKFRLTRHLLSCTNVLFRVYRSVLENRTGDDMLQYWKAFHRMAADVSVCWGMYAVYLLECSKQQLTGQDLKNSVFTEFDETAFFEASMNHRYLPADVVQQNENRIACSLASNNEESVRIYAFGRAELDEAITFYAANKRLEDYVSATRSIVKLYDHRQFFDNNVHSKCLMYRQSILLIEGLLGEVVSEEKNEELYHELLAESAEIYYQLADLQRQFPQPAETAAAASAERQYDNTSAYQAISKFKKLICSLTKDKELSTTLQEDVVMQTLEAYSRYADSHLLILGKPMEMIECLQKAKVCYEAILDYIKKNPLHEMYIHSKLTVIRERFLTLPKEIDFLTEKIRNISPS